MNPFDARSRPSMPGEHGVGYSGPTTIVRAGDRGQILNIAIRDIVPNGYYGMASVHISAEDDEINQQIELAPNAHLVGHVHYQSGNGGGDFEIDLTRGHIFAVGATCAINIEVEWVLNDFVEEGEPVPPLRIYASKKLETTVCWGTSVNPKDAMMTGLSLVVPPGIASPFLPIPRQARAMIVQGSPSASFPSLLAQFSSNPFGGAGAIKFDTLNPNANGTLIVQGVEFVRFTNLGLVDVTVFPVFELWT